MTTNLISNNLLTLTDATVQLSALMRINGIGEEVKNEYSFVHDVSPEDRALMVTLSKEIMDYCEAIVVNEIKDGISAPEHTSLVWAKHKVKAFYKVIGEEVVI